MKKILLFAAIFSFLVIVPVSTALASSNDSGEKLAFLDWNPLGKPPQPESTEVNPFATDLKGVASTLPEEYIAQESNPYTIIFNVIRILLSFLGIGTIALMIYAGARWMTARGNEEQVAEAKKTLRNAVIGLILITMAYSLTIFLVRRLQRTTGSYGGGTGFYLQLLE